MGVKIGVGRGWGEHKEVLVYAAGKRVSIINWNIK